MMSGKNFGTMLSVTVFGLFVVLTFTTQKVLADSFWKFGGKTIEAELGKEYRLAETSGPWMILVTTFSGPTAKKEADALVYELRKKYQYRAYIFEKSFIHDIRAEDKKRNPNETRRVNYKKKGTVGEYAVLIGDFQKIEETDFQNTLKGIKQCYPDCMKASPGNVTTSQTLSPWRRNTSAQLAGESRARGPFYSAFAVTNPMLPPDFFSQRGTVDKFIAEINENRPFTLLSNPGRYTLRVATFTGKIEIKQDNINRILDGKAEFVDKKGLSELELGEKSAGILCKELRKLGFEAYEFHDRYASFVTVGSFQTTGQELPGGTINLDPQIVQLMNTFQGKPANSGIVRQGTVKTVSHEPVRFAGIECDIQPVIIEVPRRQR